jgi:hypothetical protein
LNIVFKKTTVPLPKDAIIAAEVAIELLRSITMGRVGEMVGSSKFDTSDRATQNYLKGHFRDRKHRYCASWIYEPNSAYLVDKIFCSPPPIVEEKIKIDYLSASGLTYVTRNSYKRDIFPTDQDVFRITGEDWSVILKAEGTEMFYDQDDRPMGRSFASAFDVEIMGDHTALGDDMLMYKLIGFDHLTKGVL